MWLISSSVKSSNPPLPHLLKPVLFFLGLRFALFLKSLLNFEPLTFPLLVTYPVAHDDAVVLTVCTYSLSPAYLCTRVCTYHIASASWRLAPASLRMESQSGVFFFFVTTTRGFFKNNFFFLMYRFRSTSRSLSNVVRGGRMYRVVIFLCFSL